MNEKYNTDKISLDISIINYYKKYNDKQSWILIIFTTDNRRSRAKNNNTHYDSSAFKWYSDMKNSES
jgi:hypothetical protein